MTINFEMPIRATYTLNSRMHWSARQRIRKSERNAVMLALPVFKVQPLVRILLTRVGPKRMDDDNVPGALKGIRDGLADRLGIDDGSPLIKWEYAQEKRGKDYAVRVEIENTTGTIRGFGPGFWDAQAPEMTPTEALAHGEKLKQAMDKLWAKIHNERGTRDCMGCDDPTCRTCGGALTSPDALRQRTLDKWKAGVDSGEVTPDHRKRGVK